MLRYYETEKGKSEIFKEKISVKKRTLFSWEMKNSLKTWLAWLIVVSALMILTLSLYPVLHDYLVQLMNDPNFAQFASQFDFSEINIANYLNNQMQKTWAFFGAIFVVVLGIQIISKEYKDGSAEFLYSLPINKGEIWWKKFLTLVLYTVLFDLGIAVFSLITVFIVSGFNEINLINYALMTLNLVSVHLLFGMLGFALGTVYKKKANIGLGLFIVFLMYTFTVISAITPDLQFFENFSLFTILSSNILVNLFSGYNFMLLIVWALVTLLLTILSAVKFRKDDIM